MNTGEPDFVSANMALLKAHHLQTWKIMVELDPAPRGEAFRASSGGLNLRLHSPDDQTVLMHHDQDPEGVADNFLDDIDADTVVGYVICIGMGLGHGPLALIRKRPLLRYLAIFEPDPSIFMQALRSVDLSLLLSDRRVLLSIGETPDVAGLLAPGERALALEKCHILRHLPSFSLNNDAYQTIHDQVFEYANRSNVTGNTNLQRGGMFMDNRFRNMETIHHHLLLETLRNRFQDIPAILVAGGPSLDKNIDQLHRAKGKALIIAVDSALPAMLAHGVTPDFVAAIDPQDLVYEKFADVAAQTKEVSLICAAYATGKIPKIFPAEKVFWIFSRSPIEAWLCRQLGVKYITGGAATVAHATFQSACLLGCSPIVFVGQDLAFTENKDHAQHTTLTHKDTTQQTIGAQEGLVWVDSVTGGKVPTNRSFFMMKRHFEKMIESEPGRCYINATEGGAHIDGTSVMPLREVLERYCSEDQGIRERIHAQGDEPSRPNVGQLLAEYRRMIKKTKELKKSIAANRKTTRTLTKELGQLQKSGRKIHCHSDLPPGLMNELVAIHEGSNRLDQEYIWHLLQEVTMNGVRDSERKKTEIKALEGRPADFLPWLLKNLEVGEEINAVRTQAMEIFANQLSATLAFHKREEDLRRRIKNNKDQGDILNLAHLYHDSGNVTLLKSVLDEYAGQLHHTADGCFFRGVIASHMTHYEEAESCFAAAVRLQPALADKVREFREGLAEEYREFGKNLIIDSGARRSMLLKGLRYCPGYLPIIEDLRHNAVNDLQALAHQDALKAADKLRVPDVVATWCRDIDNHAVLGEILGPEQVLAFYRLLVNLQVEGKDFADAIDTCRKILRLAPASPEAYIQATGLLLTIGAYGLAIDHLRIAVSLDKSYGAYWETIGDQLLATEQGAEAIYAYEQCFLALPEQIGILKKIGDCCLEMDRPEAAREAYMTLRDKLTGGSNCVAANGCD